MTSKDDKDVSAQDYHPQPPAVIPSQDLFRGRQEVVILHDGVEYRLRLTKLGKLILNK